ncbi:MAG: isoprenylcysteine carboxylmethyltransferase family protein [Acidobacteriota bacterium]|nr:isoprenylcysteine carboxylmethyltransferase family protein [Acidobacteriota bacterium]
MADETVFRICLLAGFAVLFPAALYYRLRAHVRGEKLDRRQEGTLVLATLRPLGLLGMGGVIAYLIDPDWMAWSRVPLPDGVRWAGVATGFAAAALMIWTLHSLGRNLTDTVVTRAGATLVTDGPYRWVRHPFYLCFALAMAANAVVMANWFVGAAGALALVAMVLRTRKEEQNLIARFGDEYRAYMQRTGRFVPRFRP